MRTKVSEHKIAANRRNARRSTGPSTADGKARASRNAYRHGLAISILSDPAIAAEVERLARVMVGKRTDPCGLAQAHIIAEAEFDLLRIRSTRVKMINAMAKNTHLGQVPEEVIPDLRDPQLTRVPRSAVKSELTNARPGLLKILPLLETLERYERRVFSRRRNGIRRMYKSSI